MLARLTFLGIVAFWLTMNILLWRMEFGAHGGDTSVPVQLVWRKILTAPDAASLNVYQKGERTGFCEISTGIGQQMANYDEDKLPPEGLAAHINYQIHAAGNVSLGDFTNRLKFDCRMLFDRARNWRELNLKLTSRTMVIEIHALATNQSAHVKVSDEGTPVLERDLTTADLQNPVSVVRALAGDFPGAFAVADVLPMAPAQNIQWEARRTRVKIGAEAVPVYQLETSVLGRSIIVNVSALGEVLRVELPGDVVATIDDWNKP